MIHSKNYLPLALFFSTFFNTNLSAEPERWNPVEYGAIPGGQNLATEAMQRAIDDAHAAGGGIVAVPDGVFLIGTIELRSGVTLHLSDGTTLLGSPSVADYRRGNWPALIKAQGQRDVKITGSGTIDGQGTRVAADTIRIYESGNFLEFFPGLKPGEMVFTGIGTDKNPWIDPFSLQEEGTLVNRVAPRSREDMVTWRVDEMVRPQLIEFWQCEKVEVSGVVLKNAANWVQTYRECEDVVIRGVRVDSTTYWNNDGLDIVNCRRVLVEDCDINAADDGICLKSDPSPTARMCEEITVRHCRVRSSASAFKLGTASHHGFIRIRVEDLEVYDTYRSAIALETVDGGILNDVKITKVRARNTGNAIFLRIGHRNLDKAPGKLSDVEISDVVVQVPAGRPDEGYSHEGPPLRVPVNVIPSSIVGLPDRLVEGVLLRDVTIIYAGGGRREVAEVPLDRLDLVPEKRSNYPEFSMFGELPSWGFFMRNAKGVRFERVQLRLEGSDYRAAIVADRVSDLVMNGLAIPKAGEEPILVFSDTDPQLSNLDLPVHREQIRMLSPVQ